MEILGGYTRIREIGKGAYGTVFLASKNGKLFAVKEIVCPDSGDDSACRRELRGVEAMLRIPPMDGFIRIHDLEVAPDGGSFAYAMDLADDEINATAAPDARFYRPRSLAGVVSAEIALPLRECLDIAIRMASVLQRLHDFHIIHRDIKPGNILFIRGKAVLADVGLVVDDREAASIVGTPGYVPPERQGSPAGDLYGLGKTLYRISTGRPPEETGLPPCAEADTDSPYFWQWLSILSRATAEEPIRRYRNAKAFLRDLQRLRARMRFRRNFLLRAFAACAVVAAVAAPICAYRAFSPSAAPVEPMPAPVEPMPEFAEPVPAAVDPVSAPVAEPAPPVAEPVIAESTPASVEQAPASDEPEIVAPVAVPMAPEARHERLYCVIDLAGGPTADDYPVSYLDSEPDGGWPDEYKTTKLVLRRINPGRFFMGNWSPVVVSNGFYIGVFEVTQRQYELVAGADPSFRKGATRPVENLNRTMLRGDALRYPWKDASRSRAAPGTFIGHLRERTGMPFDLPLEIQWEYACRAGTRSAFNNGVDDPAAMFVVGRFFYNQGDGCGGYAEAHTSVGSYIPNAWGLYDMHGNAWEWCLDCGPTGRDGVVRGGNWHAVAELCTSSERRIVSVLDSGHENCSYGLRLCLPLP